MDTLILINDPSFNNSCKQLEEDMHMAPPLGKTHADGADSTICYYGTTYGCACADNLYIRADQLLCREATDNEVITAFKAVTAINV